jgi:hypothetical protein
MSQDAGIDLDYDDPAAFDAELARIQADAADLAEPEAKEIVIEGGQIVTSDRTVEFMGAQFRVADTVGLMPLLKFSAHSNMSTQDAGSLSAMYSMLKDCIHPGTPACGKCQACEADQETRCTEYDAGDWNRFEQHAIDTKADADDLLTVITNAMEVIAGRPTEQPSGSSSGRRSTRDASMARSSSRGRRGSRR